MTNHFQEGSAAYLAWFDDWATGGLPVAPYPPDSIEAKEWEQGFNDAMEWQMHGQYLD
jgi:hypothetical protein